MINIAHKGLWSFSPILLCLFFSRFFSFGDTKNTKTMQPEVVLFLFLKLSIVASKVKLTFYFYLFLVSERKHWRVVSLVSVLKWYVKCIYYVYLPDCTYSLYTVLCLPYWSQRMQHNYSRIPCWTWTVQDRAPHGKHMQDTVVLPIPSCGVRCGAAWMIGFMRANKSPKKGSRKQVPKCCRSSKCHMLWASLPSDFYNIIFSSTGRCLLKYSVILCYDKLIVAVTVAMSLTGFTGLTPPETCLQKQSLVHLRCRLFVPCWNRNTSSTASGWLTQWLDISWISEAELSMHLAKLSLSLLSFTGLREPVCCSMHKSLHRPQELLLCARLKG